MIINLIDNMCLNSLSIVFFYCFVNGLFNTTISDKEIIRIYGMRWDIEVYFKTCKSLLGLAKEFQLISTVTILLKNSFFYELTGFSFLSLGSINVWTPYIIPVAAALEIVLFFLLAVRSYSRHEAT